MSFLGRLLGRGREADAPVAPASGAPSGPIAVSDPRAALSDQVANLLARPELEFLIVLWDERRNLFAQFSPTRDGGLLAELTGDRYLEPRHRLREAQRTALAGQGWRMDETAGNWQRTWPPGTVPSAIAADCAGAMEVYGTAPRAEWTITFGAD